MSDSGKTNQGDGFNGNDEKLCGTINTLLNLDAANALVPHGIGGRARTLLAAAASRLQARAAVSAPQPAGPVVWISKRMVEGLLRNDRIAGNGMIVSKRKTRAENMPFLRRPISFTANRYRPGAGCCALPSNA